MSSPLLPLPGSIPSMEFSGAPVSSTPENSSGEQDTENTTWKAPHVGLTLSERPLQNSQIPTYFGVESRPENSLVLDWPRGSGFPETTAKQKGESSAPHESSGIPQGSPSLRTHRGSSSSQSLFSRNPSPRHRPGDREEQNPVKTLVELWQPGPKENPKILP